ncbi:hypothetical protein [Mixta intestinalis]|uniref:Uncharacterized protein n=1 Tax=Mixta intestinalis TaxID=1615494 RepID=A0A6P1PZN6_9GAMM|nr:hypothetical protein [Mixta intestinalis]QHM71327.1 hypothetical protein C7M51_01613 [Mixta intestinalis]
MKMTNEKRQALIKQLQGYIDNIDDGYDVFVPQSEFRHIAKIALAALTAEPVKVPDDNLARQTFEKHVRTHYQYPMLERHPEGDDLRAGEYREIDRQREWEGWLLSWSACRAEVLRLNKARS